VSTASRAGPFGVVVRLVLAVLRSRCAGLARPSLPRRALGLPAEEEDYAVVDSR